VHDDTRDRTRRVRTTNKLIERPGTEVLAAKTGYTDTARHCFAGVFRTRDGRRVAVATLGGYRSSHRWGDVRALLSWVEQGAGD
jgi:D-alanyl-D-alanine carboxypeptidase